MFALKLSLLLCAVALASARAPKILGGVDSDPSNFPYHVALLKVNEDGTAQHVCGGAIIERRYILTAAYCVADLESKDLLVRTGGNEGPPSNKPHQERRVFRRVSHIMYPIDYVKNERYHEYDIAVVKIQGTFDLADEKVFKKVQLPIIDNDYEDKLATISGYGVHDATQAEPKAEGEGFKSLQTKVIPVYECQASRTFILTRGSMCTQSIQTKGHTCYGDGGNPLVYENQVIGILNNPSTCDDTRPELYTRVSAYISFINKVLEGQFSSDIMYK